MSTPARKLSIVEATVSYDCKTPGCTREARSNRGPYAYLCDGCIAADPARTERQRERARAGAIAREANRSLGPLAKELVRAAADLDLARSKVKQAESAHRRRIAPLKTMVEVAERNYLRIVDQMGLAPKEQPDG